MPDHHVEICPQALDLIFSHTLEGTYCSTYRLIDLVVLISPFGGLSRLGAMVTRAQVALF